VWRMIDCRVVRGCGNCRVVRVAREDEMTDGCGVFCVCVCVYSGVCAESVE